LDKANIHGATTSLQLLTGPRGEGLNDSKEEKKMQNPEILTKVESGSGAQEVSVSKLFCELE
jgi:hypothetical protein